MTKSMFDTLLTLPLFQGLSYDDVARILESSHPTLRQSANGNLLALENNTCSQLLFVCEGDICMKTYSADRSWYVEEELHAPQIIGLDTIFSPSTCYRSTYTSISPIQYFTLDKRTIHALTEYFEVFRLNIINSLASAAFRKDSPRWLPPQETLEKRLINFFREHISYPAGKKVFHISMKTLGLYLGRDQRYISRALKKLESQGLLQMKNRCYEIPHFEKLWQQLLP